MLFTNTLVLAFAATATAAPQFTWPTWGGGSTGGSTGGTTTSRSTANDVTNKVPCQPITVIFARGTSEGGNIGSVVGPPLRTALNGKANFQGVPYPASVAGNSNGGGTGGQLMVDLANQARQQCPTTKIILSGYSQGGSVVHKAGTLLTSATTITAAVIFGDPANGQPVKNVANLKEYCNRGDKVCEAPKSFAITAAHGTYGRDGSTDDAAKYISSVTGVAL